jgi:hypothetical protein
VFSGNVAGTRRIRPNAMHGRYNPNTPNSFRLSRICSNPQIDNAQTNDHAQITWFSRERRESGAKRGKGAGMWWDRVTGKGRGKSSSEPGVGLSAIVQRAGKRGQQGKRGQELLLTPLSGQAAQRLPAKTVEISWPPIFAVSVPRVAARS